ncbi:MAG: serine hydrolase domain-containing protein [Caldilineaceae bacterium]
MKVHLNLSIFFLMLSIVGSINLLGEDRAARQALGLPPVATINSFITQQMAAQRVPGLALAIVQGDEILYVQGYGAARASEPVTAQTQFLLASLSKSFTAVAVLQLVEAGKLDLDAPVQRYLPSFGLADPAAAASITVRQLLNQVSGLADAGFPEMRLPAPASLAERITTLRTAQTVSAPRSAYHYFNVNYQILARLVEVVSDQPFSTYLQREIFTPLQMEHTVNLITSADLAQRPAALAQGHLLAFGLPLPSGEENGFLGGSGGVVSTAEDMAHYLVMQNNGGSFQGAQLLSPRSVALLHTPPATIDSPYAMGWWTATTADGTSYLEHNGVLSTFYAEMVLLPQTGQSFVLLYNIHSLAQDVFGVPAIKAGLIDLLTNRPVATGGFNVSLWSIVIALITLLSVALEVRGLVRLPRWRQQAAIRPTWRLLLGVLWSLMPVAFVLAMPAIVLRSSGRAFGYLTLFRSMVGVMSWLGLCGVLGVVNGLVRGLWLARRTRR